MQTFQARTDDRKGLYRKGNLNEVQQQKFFLMQ